MLPLSALLLGVAVAGAAVDGLDGTWRQACRSGLSREESFAGGRAVYTERNAWDPACAQPALEVISRGTIVDGGAVAEPAGARALDFVFVSVSLRPADAGTAADWNARALCGFRDWAVGAERDVTGLACDLFGMGSPGLRVPRAGDRRYGVVEASGSDSLYFGRLSPERDGSSAEKRPLELDPAPFHRVP